MRSFRKQASIHIIVTALVLFLAMFLQTDVKASAKGNIAMSTAKKTMYVGRSSKLILNNAEGKKVKWKSSNSSVLSIQSHKNNVASLKAEKKGTATVKAKLNGKTYRCKVTIKDPSLASASMTVDKGEAATLGFRGSKAKTKLKIVKWAKISSKAETENKIYWAVKNTSVLSISKKNNRTINIKVKKAGTTYIKAKYNGKEYKCKVTTKNPQLAYTSRTIGVKKTRTLSFSGKRSSTTSTIVKWDNLSAKPNTYRKIYWAVKDPEILTMTVKAAATMTLAGERVGSTYVRAKYRGKIYQCKVTVTIPACWNTELEKSIIAVQARESAGVPMAKFIYLTDSHWNSNAQRSPALINYLSEKLDIPFTVFGGDAITSHHTTQADAITELQDFYAQFDVNLFSTTGNHDWNTESNTDVLSYLSEDQLFRLMYSKQSTFAVTENNGKCAYLDDAQNKIRYISFYFDTRLNIEPYVSLWVDERIRELPEGWTVMLFSHAYYKASRLGAAENTIPGASDYANHLLELQKDVDADVAAWMVGHCHRDLSTKLTYQEDTDTQEEDTDSPDSSDDTVSVQDNGKEAPTLLIVSTNCDTYKQSSQWGGEVMTLNTATEQAFEIVQLNTQSKKLYLTRVGAGQDREFDY